MEAPSVCAHEDEPRVGDDPEGVGARAGEARGHPAHAPVRPRRPDLGAQRPHGLGDEAVVQVCEHDVVVVAGCGVVEGDRPRDVGDRVVEVGRGARPGPAECWHLEHPDRHCGPRQGGGPQRRLVGERERALGDPLDVVGVEVELFDALVELAAELGDAPFDVAPEPVERPGGVTAIRARLGVGVGRAAEHRRLHLVGEDGRHGAQVVSDGLDLVGDQRQEREVGLEGAAGDPAPPLGGGVLPARADEVVDEDLRGGLAVSVDPAVALVEARGREGDLDVDEPVAVALEVDALARGVGRQKDPHRAEPGGCWNSSLIRSRASSSMPPYKRARRSPPSPRASKSCWR